MSWFEEQIELRNKADREAFEDSCLQIAGSVTGKKISAALHDGKEQTSDAVAEILDFYHVKQREVPEEIKSLDDILEYLLRPSGIMTREVVLRERWSKDASGAMLTTFRDGGMPVALIPDGVKGYRYLNPATGNYAHVDRQGEKLFADEAFVFYKPLPNEKLTVRTLYRYILDSVDKKALAGYLVFGVVAVFAGMLLPLLSRNLFSSVIPSGSASALAAVAVFIFCASVGKFLFSVVQDLYLKKISLGVNLTLESATMMRVLSLPSSFFKEYSAGDLGRRVSYMSLLAGNLIDMGFAGLFAAGISMLYVFQIFTFAAPVAVPALIVTLLVIATDIITLVLRAKINVKQMELSAKESGLSYSFISGIEKIRLSGAESRAFAKWGKAYARQAELLYNPPAFIKVSKAVARIIPLLGAVVIYVAAIRSGMSVGDYYAFNTAFGMVTGALTSLGLIIGPASVVRPILETVKPIMETVPEVSEDKTVIDKISGAVELNNISFRYKDNMPMVLNNLSLKIKPGQYVAITGRTGCGKSTLMRILLGFETPQKGAVYYDGRDLSKIDLKSLRSRIGTVMQDGQLFSGDIYSNIAISAPGLTVDQAWEVAEAAGIANDIREMPMGMFTLISEGAGEISGGQKQRLLIARAIASHPKILMFDEATSALDNIAQKQVSESLDKLDCTRIVIAHRLSTIKHCDRIVVLDNGTIVEDGTYESLMKKKGFFAELVKRQQVEKGENA